MKNPLDQIWTRSKSARPTEKRPRWKTRSTTRLAIAGEVFLIEDEGLQAETMKTLSKRKDIWSESVGTFKATPYTIDTKQKMRLIWNQPYCIKHLSKRGASKAHRTTGSGCCNEISPVWMIQSQYIVSKEGWRFSVLFKLSASQCRHYISDTFPLTHMDDFIVFLGKAKLFKALDNLGRYWQVPIKDEDKDETIFTSPLGTYYYNCILFVLHDAPATFQPTLNIFQSAIRCQKYLVCSDEAIIFPGIVANTTKTSIKY